MSKMNAIIYFLNWFLRWLLTTLVGMIFFVPDKFEFLGATTRPYRRDIRTKSIIRTSSRDGSWTETEVEGDVSPYSISSSPGTKVEVRRVSYGPISGLMGFNIILVILNIIVLASIAQDAFYPAMRNYTKEPSLLIQIILIVLILVYLFNLVLVFIKGYLDNREAGIHPIANKLVCVIAICLTMVYVVWLVHWLAETKVGIYFPFKYIS